MLFANKIHIKNITKKHLKTYIHRQTHMCVFVCVCVHSFSAWKIWDGFASKFPVFFAFWYVFGRVIIPLCHHLSILFSTFFLPEYRRRRNGTSLALLGNKNKPARKKHPRSNLYDMISVLCVCVFMA